MNRETRILGMRKASRSTPQPGPILGIIYVRVSSREQAEGFSLDAQLDLLREYARKNAIKVVREFREAESARKAGRTAFHEMLDFLIANPNVRSILVEKTDRLYRNFHDFAKLDIESMNLHVHLVKENEILSKDSRSHQKFIHSVKLAMAKNYCDNLSEEVVKGLDQKALKGLWPTYAPIGYRNTPEHGIDPDVVEAPLVRLAFGWAASGTYTLNKLRRALFDAGLRSRRAKKMLGKEAIRRVIANPMYMGQFVWKGRVHEGVYKPLVTPDLFDRAQIAMGLRARPRETKHKFAFTGLILCSHCGASITAEIKKRKYVYYRCARQCEAVTYVREQDIVIQLGDALRRIQVTQDVVDWTREALLSSHQDQTDFHRESVVRLVSRREKVTGYLDQAYTDRVEGRIADDLWLRRSDQWKCERDEINQQIASHEAAKTNYLESGVKLLELAQVAHSLYVSRNPEEQRQLINFVLSNCRMHGASVEYDWRKPFDLLADSGEIAMWRGGRDLNPRPPA